MNVTITCGACKHEADADEFSKTVTGPLPKDTFQCPKCHRAVRLYKGPITVRDGRVISVPNKLVPTQSQL